MFLTDVALVMLFESARRETSKMDHQRQSAAHMTAALRWRIVAVDDTLLAIDYEDSQLNVQELSVDTATRVVRSGAREPVAFPVSLPPDAEWIASSRVQDVALAVPLTLLVFRTTFEESDGESRRPAKRVRRDTKTKTTATATRLLVFSLWCGGDWELTPVGDVVLPGTDLSVHVADGPYILAHSSMRNELSLLGFVLTGDGDYWFQVTRSGLPLPVGRGDARVKRLVSCQLVDVSVTPVPHLLIQFMRTEEDAEPHNDVQTMWTPGDEQRHWATLSLVDESDEDSAGHTIAPCSYLPAKWLVEDPLSAVERVTSCAFVGQDSRIAWEGRSRHRKPIQLHPSVIMLVGTSAGVLHVISNDVSLASFVFSGAPHSIRVVNAANSVRHSGHISGPLVVAVQCADSDSTFQLLSVDCRRQPGRAIKPLQHFTYVGTALALPPDSNSSTDISLVLLNDLKPNVDSGFLDRSLRKSVVVHADWGAPEQVVSSCHRLKFRLEEKKSKKKKKRGNGAADEDAEDKFQCIERIKVDWRDPDLDSDNRKSTPSSSASEQQLLSLAKSLQERLRIGREQHQRLQQIGADKVKTVIQLNSLLADESDQGGARSRQQSVAEELLKMVPVVVAGSAQSLTSAEIVEGSVDRRRENALMNPVLEAASVEVYERSTSTLRLQVTVRIPRGGEDLKSVVRSISVGPRDSIVALRSSSTVCHSSSPIGESTNNNLPSHRFSFDVDVEIPVQSILSARYSARLGLWLRTESDANAPLSHFLGDVEIDAKLLASQSILSHEGALKWKAATSTNSRMPGREQLLLLSGGSSLHEVLHKLKSTVPAIPFSSDVARQLFATVRLPAAAFDKLAFGQFLATLPDDVIAMVNPLELSSISSVLDLIHSLQSELQLLQVLENIGDDDHGARSHLLEIQGKTDLQVLRLLNEWQQRINFHSAWGWGSKKASPLTSSTNA